MRSEPQRYGIFRRRSQPGPRSRPGPPTHTSKPGAPGEHVRPGAAPELVVAWPAAQPVAPRSPARRVTAPEPARHVAAAGEPEGLAALAAREVVRRGAAQVGDLRAGAQQRRTGRAVVELVRGGAEVGAVEVREVRRVAVARQPVDRAFGVHPAAAAGARAHVAVDLHRLRTAAGRAVAARHRRGTGEEAPAVEVEVKDGRLGRVAEGDELGRPRAAEGDFAPADHILDPAPLLVAGDPGCAQVLARAGVLRPGLGREQLARGPAPERPVAVPVAGDEDPVGGEAAAEVGVVDAVARRQHERVAVGDDDRARADEVARVGAGGDREEDLAVDPGGKGGVRGAAVDRGARPPLDRPEALVRGATQPPRGVGDQPGRGRRAHSPHGPVVADRRRTARGPRRDHVRSATRARSRRASRRRGEQRRQRRGHDEREPRQDLPPTADHGADPRSRFRARAPVRSGRYFAASSGGRASGGTQNEPSENP